MMVVLVVHGDVSIHSLDSAEVFAFKHSRRLEKCQSKYQSAKR